MVLIELFQLNNLNEQENEEIKFIPVFDEGMFFCRKKMKYTTPIKGMRQF